MIITIDQTVKQRAVQANFKSVENMIHEKGEVYVVDSQNNPRIAMVDFNLYSELKELFEHVQDYISVTKARTEKTITEEELEKELGISLK